MRRGAFYVIAGALVAHDYCFHSIVLGIVKSSPFLKRSTELPERVEASAARPLA